MTRQISSVSKTHISQQLKENAVKKKILTSQQKKPPEGTFLWRRGYKPAVVLAVAVFSRRCRRFQVVLGSQRSHGAELRGILDGARARPLVGPIRVI